MVKLLKLTVRIYDRHRRRCRICYGPRIHDAVDPHKQREYDDQWQQEYDLSRERYHDPKLRLSDGCKETG